MITTVNWLEPTWKSQWHWQYAWMRTACLRADSPPLYFQSILLYSYHQRYLFHRLVKAQQQHSTALFWTRPLSTTKQWMLLLRFDKLHDCWMSLTKQLHHCWMFVNYRYKFSEVHLLCWAAIIEVYQVHCYFLPTMCLCVFSHIDTS